MAAANLNSCTEREKYVIIIMDEMHIKESLIYNKHTGALNGFTDLGDINAHFEAYGRETEAEILKKSLASSVLVIRVRGLFSNLKFPYAQFPCISLSGNQLYEPLWEAVYRLERMGFKVLGITCDGLAANRRMFDLHRNRSKDDVVYKVLNPHPEEKRYLFFLCDPPHLIKTVRNSWENRKRMLWFHKEISWSHLQELYDLNRSSAGLSLIPKLKYEHLNLTSFSKMRVDLASQVLSSSVSNGLTMMLGTKAEATSKFVKMFDNFFDCMNTSYLSAAERTKNPFKGPYRSKDDFRLKWLTDTFIPYLDDWEKCVRNRKEYSTSQQNMMMLSRETRLGLRITAKSFIELVQYLFTIPGVEVFMSNQICQDPLENFFGQQHQRGSVNQNPTLQEFLCNTQALRVINNTCRDVRGNCGGSKKRNISTELDNSPLPKRQRSGKK